MVEYISHFATELFDGEVTQCRLEFPAVTPNLALPPEMRHNIFLVVKEALTNTLKHAHAPEVVVEGEFRQNWLKLQVSDNGRGWDPSQPTTRRNGIGNMQRRAEAMGGSLEIESAPGKGARVALTLNLPAKLAQTPLRS